MQEIVFRGRGQGQGQTEGPYSFGANEIVSVAFQYYCTYLYYNKTDADKPYLKGHKGQSIFLPFCDAMHSKVVPCLFFQLSYNLSW